MRVADVVLGLVMVTAIGCSGDAEDPSCAAIRRGVEMCEPGTGVLTCAGMPSSYRVCADRVPNERSDEACASFMGCLYDGP